MRGLFFLLLYLPAVTCFSGDFKAQDQADSLTAVLNATPDSAKIDLLLSLSWDLRNTDPGKSVEYGTRAIELAEKYKDYSDLARAYGFVGVAYRIMGKYSESIDFYMKGHEIAEKYGLKEQTGYAHLNLANLYIYQEHYSLAIEYLKAAEKTAVESNNKPMLAYVYLYFGRAQKLQNDLDAALASYRKSLAIRQELGQTDEEATCYKYIGDIFFEKNQLDAAEENYDKSIEKINKENDKDLYASVLVQKSKILLARNKLKEASEMAHSGLDIACKIGANRSIRDALLILADISSVSKDYKSAYQYEKKVSQYNDSLFNQKLSEKIFSIEYQMAEEQRQTKIDLLNKDNAIKELELKRIRYVTIGLGTILVLLVGSFVLLLITLKHRRDRARLLEQQNQEIVKQRNSIEEQNRMLTETNQKLEQSEDSLRKMIQTKDKLFSIIAHDLRSPFNALSGLTEVLQIQAASIKNSEIAEYAGLIHESSRKLLNLIENLLQWANSQTGRLKVIPRTIDLMDIVGDVLKVLKDQADTKEITLLNEVPESAMVFADYDSLATIIRNLVSNGIKYSHNKGLVKITAERQDTKTIFKVSDTGIGIQPEKINKLFRIEESFTTEGTNHEPGSGLGLIICKEFVEHNQGTIKVESTPGEGTTFTVTLPNTDLITG